MQNQFYKNLPGIKDGIFDALMERGYFQHRPDYVRNGFVGGGIAVGVLHVRHRQCARAKDGNAPSRRFSSRRFVSAAIIVGFGWFMPARTAAGAKALAGVLGFEDFLTHVEADRMDRIDQTPETFEKFLPFAMALGVEKKWVGAFQNIYTQPPSWYQGGLLRRRILSDHVRQQPGQDDGAREFRDGFGSAKQRRFGFRRRRFFGRRIRRRRRRRILRNLLQECRRLLPAGKLHDPQRDLVTLIIPIIDSDFVTQKHSSHGRSQHKLFVGSADPARA